MFFPLNFPDHKACARLLWATLTKAEKCILVERRSTACQDGGRPVKIYIPDSPACSSFTNSCYSTKFSLAASKDTCQSHGISRKCCISLCFWDRECTRSCICHMPRCCIPSNCEAVCTACCIGDSRSKHRCDARKRPLPGHWAMVGRQHLLMLP